MLKNDVIKVKVDIENCVKPQIYLLAENYVPTAKRYEASTYKIESLEADVEVLKMVVAEHSEKLQKIS